MRTGGFSEVARQLNEHYELGDGGVTRQQVYQWWKRETKNAAGQAFPREASQGTVPYHRGPARLFDLDEALDWASPGVPGIHSNQFGGLWKSLRE